MIRCFFFYLSLIFAFVARQLETVIIFCRVTLLLYHGCRLYFTRIANNSTITTTWSQCGCYVMFIGWKNLLKYICNMEYKLGANIKHKKSGKKEKEYWKCSTWSEMIPKSGYKKLDTEYKIMTLQERDWRQKYRRMETVTNTWTLNVWWVWG